MNDLGAWITDGTGNPFYVRKVFACPREVRSATARVCGLGQLVFWLNGEKVGDHELDPGWTDYRRLVEYVTFDVTRHLRPGRNALGAEVGNGWYCKNDEHYTFAFPAFMPPNPNPYRPFGRSLVFALDLAVEYADGTREHIHADESFRTAPHPVVQSNVYGSETIDHARRQTGWAQADFDDARWARAIRVAPEDAPAGELIEQLQPPVRVLRTYDAVRLGTVNGREIYDLGQNMSGILSLSLRGRKGDTVRVYPAEKLGPDGDVDQVAKGWATVDSVLTCVLGTDGEWEDFRMRFTYFAGRVLAVERSSAGVALRRLRADAISSAWKRAGSFVCDDERFNRIYTMIERTVEANLLSVHTDCPTIERFAWQETNHLMAPSILFMKDGRALWEKFLLDLRAAQHTAKDLFLDLAGNRFAPGEGLMPAQAPCYIPNVLPVPGMGSFYDSIAWGSACILGARWHYLFYGDRRIIEDNYDAGKRYLAYLRTRINAEGFINHGLGDWGNPDGALARENVETAFPYADAVTLADFARVLDRPEEEAEIRRFAEDVRGNYNEKLLVQGADGRWFYRNYEDKTALSATQACEAPRSTGTWSRRIRRRAWRPASGECWRSGARSLPARRGGPISSKRCSGTG